MATAMPSKCLIPRSLRNAYCTSKVPNQCRIILSPNQPSLHCPGSAPCFLWALGLEGVSTLPLGLRHRGRSAPVGPTDEHLCLSGSETLPSPSPHAQQQAKPVDTPNCG